MKSIFTIGSRGSRLALWQTDYVKTELEKRFPRVRFEVRIIKTTGDVILDTALSKIGDKGLFTTQIENALLLGEIDLAVHSLKDLPTTQPKHLKIGAVSAREMPNDALISKHYSSLEDLPKNAKIATGSLRRKSQLLHFRPDLEVVEIRGNVPTRIEK
nr:hydroxymethylbilane synthase [Acidobacteriota bacterium]